MPRRSTQFAILAALLTGAAAGGPSLIRGADPVTPFDPQPSAVDAINSVNVSGWVPWDAAFRNDLQERSAFPPTVPLLQIPAVSRPHASADSPDGTSSTGVSHEGDSPAQGPSISAFGAAAADIAEPRGERIPGAPSRPTDPFSSLQKLGDSPSNALDALPRLVLMTLLVLATCLGSLMLGRRWLMKSGLVAEAPRSPRLQIVASLTISPRSQLHVVRYDDREILVGVDSRGLRQIQMVTPSFDTVLCKTQEPEPRSTKGEESPEIRSGQPARRVFTAA